MSTIVISVRPVYVSKILNGSKIFEYRRVLPTKRPSCLLIYGTSPVSKIVAAAEVVEVLSLPLPDLWSATSGRGGIEKSAFDDYFRGKDSGFAIRIGRIYHFDNPLTLGDVGLKTAPHSFAYSRGKEILALRNNLSI